MPHQLHTPEEAAPLHHVPLSPTAPAQTVPQKAEEPSPRRYDAANRSANHRACRADANAPPRNVVH